MRTLAASVASAAMIMGGMPAAFADTAATHSTSAAAGADSSYSLSANDNIVRSFLRTGAHINASGIGDAAALLDLSGYMSHPCFMPVGEQEVQECMKQFGGSFHLHESLRNGSLQSAMHRVLPTIDPVTLSAFIEGMKDKVAGESSVGVSARGAASFAQDDNTGSSSSASSRRTLDERAARVWQYCEADEHRGTCFGRYARLVHDTNLDIDETLGAIIGVRAGQRSSSSSESSSSMNADDDQSVQQQDDDNSSSRLRIRTKGSKSSLDVEVETESSSSVQY